MGRSSSVFNKRANEQVQSAKTGNSIGITLPQAHAQIQNQSPQARTQSTQFDPWARINQFAQNVGRGAGDTAKSYTTDIADTAHAIVTGKEQEQRSYSDETLATVFGRGLFESNLEGSFSEASRRIQEQPGRVVGEVAAEAAILGATMGFGAIAKGAKVGMTGVKSVRGATKLQGSTGWTRKTGLIRKGQEQKFIGDKTTTIIKTNRKGKVTTRTKKTNILDRMERFGAKGGEKFNTKIGRPATLGSPMIIGASGKGAMTGDDMIRANKLVDEVNENMTPQQRKDGMEKIINEVRGWGNENAGYMQQYEQFQAGNLGHVSGITKQSGLFEGVAAPARSPTRGVLEFNEPITRITGMSDNTPPTGVLDASDINPQYYKGKDDNYYVTKLNDETRPIANKLIKDFTTKIKNDKGLKAARERATKVNMADQREGVVQPVDGVVSMEMMGGSPSSIPIDQSAVLKVAKAQIHKTISEGGTQADARTKVDKIINWYRKETIRQDEQVANEVGSLGTPAGNVGSPMVKFNLVDEIRPSVKTDPETGELVKVKYDSEPGPIILGENYGTWGKSAGSFDDANKVMREMGGELETGGAKIKDELNAGSQMANRYDTAAQYRSSLNFFTVAQRKQYDIIRTAKPDKPSALASQELRSSLPPTLEGYMQGSVGQKGLTMSETQNMLFFGGYGGNKKLAQEEASAINTLFTGIRTPFSNVKPSKTNPVTAQQIRVQKQEAFIKGDTSIISPFEDSVPKWTKEQIAETGIKAPQFVKDQNTRITSPGYYDPKTGKFIQEDVESILTAIQFESAPSKAGPRIFQSVDMRDVGFSLGKTQDILRNTRYSGATGKPINMNKLRTKGKKAPKPKKLTNEDILKFRSQQTKKTSKPRTKRKQTVEDIWSMGKTNWADLGSIGF